MLKQFINYKNYTLLMPFLAGKYMRLTCSPHCQWHLHFSDDLQLQKSKMKRKLGRGVTALGIFLHIYSPNVRHPRPNLCAPSTTPTHSKSPTHAPSQATISPKMASPKPLENRVPHHTAPPSLKPCGNTLPHDAPPTSSQEGSHQYI